ncbi:MAG: undecaprenyl-diphosphate phosphatase [Proteobacteria bacterium]|nr:undecaprenyl-diphosphate phosphatase [Pseudomonadota bacterium]
MTGAYTDAVLMGLVEAVTEFLPVSSTGHLILAGEILGFQGPPGRVFEVAIQLGSVLAICVLYFKRLWDVLMGLRHDAGARHFAIVSVIAFIPAVIAGVLLHDVIKTVLFSPVVVCTMLFVGGFAILAIERLQRDKPQFHTIEAIPYRTALMIGLAQCLALVPGVSRSGATIMGALCFGVDRKTAAEFSFFQAIPLMAGAVAYDLWKNKDTLDMSGASIIAVGFVTAFLAALVVVRWMLGFVTKHGFAPFAWYRIALGAIGLFYFLIIR